MLEGADADGERSEAVLRGDVRAVRARRESAAARGRARAAVQAELDSIQPVEAPRAVPAETLAREREALEVRGSNAAKTAAKVATDEHTWELFVAEQELDVEEEHPRRGGYERAAHAAWPKAATRHQRLATRRTTKRLPPHSPRARSCARRRGLQRAAARALHRRICERDRADPRAPKASAATAATCCDLNSSSSRRAVSTHKTNVISCEKKDVCTAIFQINDFLRRNLLLSWFVVNRESPPSRLWYEYEHQAHNHERHRSVAARLHRRLSAAQTSGAPFHPPTTTAIRAPLRSSLRTASLSHTPPTLCLLMRAHSPRRSFLSPCPPRTSK